MPHARLRAERRRRHWSQARVGRTLRVDPSAVSLWESCQRRPRPATAAILADLFGVPADVLLAPYNEQDDARKPTSAASHLGDSNGG